MRAGLIVLAVLVFATAAALVPPRVAGIGRDTVTMTVWGQPFEDRLFVDRYARGFEKVHPGVRVDYLRHAEIEAKYSTWHSRGWGPEVMRIRITAYHQMVARGMLEPLDGYIADEKSGLSKAEMAAFPSQLLDSMRVGGKLYALPQDTAQFGLYYNKTIFDQYNREHPGERLEYPNGKWTWEKMREAARKLARHQTSDPASPLVVSGFDTLVWEWPFMQFFFQAGGELWTEDGLTTSVESDAAVEAMMYLASLVKDGSWQPSFGELAGSGPADRFQTGQIAMYMDGSWRTTFFELYAPELDFAVAAPPVHTTGRNVAGSVVWGISAHAARKDLGWEMVRWLVQEPQAAAYWDTLRLAPPANLTVVNSASFRSTGGIADPAREGAFFVPPMAETRFADRAAWITELMTPDAKTGEARSYIPSGLYEAKLEEEIRDMIREFLRGAAHADEATARALLARTARNVHGFIDRDRAARGMPAVHRR